MKKIVSLLLVLVMLLSSMTFALTSCGEEEVKEEKKEPVSSEPVEEGDIFAERAAIADGLGDYDFGGKKFRIATHKPGDFFIEEDNRNKGDLIADAKFNRNASVDVGASSTFVPKPCHGFSLV